jgi:hypothetical protein
MTTAIQAEGLVKQFGATRALDGVDLDVPAATGPPNCWSWRRPISSPAGSSCSTRAG